MRALLVGGTGFVSSVLARLLWAGGHDVAIVKRGRSADDLPAEVERLLADRTVPGELDRVLAGRAFDVVYDFTAYQRDAPRQLYALLGRRMGRYVLLSSGQVYAWPIGDPIRETDPVGPTDPYGIGKWEAELAAEACARETGVPAVVVRGNITYGPRDGSGRRLVHLVQRAFHGLPILVPGRAGVLANFTYVEDLARLLEAAGTAGIPGDYRVFNAGGAEVHDLARLLGAVFGAVGRSVPVAELGLEVGAFDALPERGAVEWHLNAFWNTVFDTTRARTELGWQPRVDLDEGISRTVASLWRHPECGWVARPVDAPAFRAMWERAEPVVVVPGTGVAHAAFDPEFGDTPQHPSPVASAPRRFEPLSDAEVAVLATAAATPSPTRRNVVFGTAGLLESSGLPSAEVESLVERTAARGLLDGAKLTATGYLSLLDALGSTPDVVASPPFASLAVRAGTIVRYALQGRTAAGPAGDRGNTSADALPSLSTLPDGVLERFESFAAFAEFHAAATDPVALLAKWRACGRRRRVELAQRHRMLSGDDAGASNVGNVLELRAIEAGGRVRSTGTITSEEWERQTGVAPALAAFEGFETCVASLARVVREARGTGVPAFGAVRIAPSRPELPPLPVVPGTPAPDFEADATSGRFRLSAHRGRWIVLYFYPMDETPGCTAQGCQFRDDRSRYDAAGAMVVGVSVDPPDSHARFRTRYGLPFELVSDVDRRVSRLYGVLDPQYGWARRVTFLVDPAGVVREVVPVDDVSGQSEQVLRLLAHAA